MGAAAGLYRYIKEDEALEQGMDAAKKVLTEVSGLDTEGALAQMILAMYAMILDGKSVADLRRAADAAKAKSLNAII